LKISIVDAYKPLTVEEVRGDLNLKFERLTKEYTSSEEGKVLGEQALFSGKFKGKYQNCDQAEHKSFQ
jgi:hypothetical protein